MNGKVYIYNVSQINSYTFNCYLWDYSVGVSGELIIGNHIYDINNNIWKVTNAGTRNAEEISGVVIENINQTSTAFPTEDDALVYLKGDIYNSNISKNLYATFHKEMHFLTLDNANHTEDIIDSEIPFDNTSTGMTSDNVHNAIIEAFNHGGGIDIEKDDTPVSTEATTLNFQGIGLTVTDEGSNKTTIEYGEDTNKADKVSGATDGNFAGLDTNGNLTDSTYNNSSFDSSGTASGLITTHETTYDHTKLALVDDKADKVSPVVEGNFAGLDVNGNLTDSGFDETSFDSSGTASGLISTHESTYDHTKLALVDDKADKVISPTEGNFAGLDVNGNLTDSGYDETSFDSSGTASGLLTTHETTYDHTDIALNTADRHTHTNKTELDGIDSTDITNWDTAYTHSQVTTGNPHNVTTSDIGAIPTSEKGSANGVATLGADGKVPTIQLPSYVDDVVEYADLASFPVTGESGKIYVALDTNKTYRWSGSVYIEISPSEVNSVNGQTGIIELTTDNISDELATKKYYSETLFDSSLSGKTTDDLTEGTTNLYFSGKTTDDLTEGTTNLYFSGKTSDDLDQGTTNKYYSSTLFDTDLATKNTDDLANNSNISGTTLTDALNSLVEVNHAHEIERIDISSTITAPGTIGTLSSATLTKSDVEVRLNGQDLLNFELDNIDGQFKVENDLQTLTWIDTSFDLETTDKIIVKYLKSGSLLHTHIKEKLTVTATNTISDLTYTPTSATLVELRVNGIDILNEAWDVGNGFFSVSGKSIIWNSSNAGYDIVTTDKVIAVYVY